VQDVSATVDDAARDGPEEPAAGTMGGTGGAGAASQPAAGAKRLYKMNDGAMIAGVCNGLAAYFNIDVTVIRILFAILTVFTWGVGLLLYVVMALIIPAAQTPAEKAAAYGMPSTAEEFIRRAKQGYYEGFKTFRDKRAHREWKRRFKQEMRGWSRNLRREIDANAFRWRHNWQQHWARHPGPVPGAWVVVPVLTLITVLLTMLGLFAVASLVATGAVFGLALPAGIPLWVGIVALLVAVNVVLWPLKAMRYSFYGYHLCGPGYPGPFASLAHSFVWLGVLVLLVWFADRHVPEVHAALDGLRPHVRHAIDALRQWWAGR
jgi:phage shock protein PspC (stress-responsive transcriptional regulator)/uncharacterized membrane protein